MNVVAQISCFFVYCRLTEIAQRIFKYDVQNTSLTAHKELYSLIYRILFYVNIYVSYKNLQTLKNCPVFGPPCTLCMYM